MWTGPKHTLAARPILKTDLLFLDLHEERTPRTTSVSFSFWAPFILPSQSLILFETCYLNF
jgi:hypothetical protein